MRQVQRQQLQQRLSPQQIQLMRLLQLPVTDLEMAIKEEVEKNPLLEGDAPEELSIDAPAPDPSASDWDADTDDEADFDYSLRLEHDPNAVRREFVVSEPTSALQRLNEQLGTRPLTDRQRAIATELIGTLDDAGYLGRSLDLVANDMAFRQGIDTTPSEVEQVLHIVQSLDPPGIGARNLQECLLLQLQRMEASSLVVRNATEIVAHHFDDFANHRYDRIRADLAIADTDLDQAADLIRSLDPKPGNSEAESQSAAGYITPDVVLVRHDDELQFYLNDDRLPHLSINTYYTDLLQQLQNEGGDRQTIQFLRSKQSEAEEFIDLLRQRHDTIVRIMRYLVEHQRQFLLTGNPDLLQPLRQREVAEATGLDISTISRMANSKYLQTDFGTIPLKDCFSKGMATDDGDEMSVEAVKQRLTEAINAEDKHAPLSDDALASMLNAQGIPLARRTVAKYREQLGFPIARLRRVVMLLALLLAASVGRSQMSYYDSLMAERYNKAVEAERSAASAKPTTTAKPSKAAKSSKRGAATASKASTKASPKAEAKSAAKSNSATSPSQPTAEQTAEAKAPSNYLPEALAPMWYDDFPQYRVNPLGRTTLVELPDEITLTLVVDSSEFCFPVKNIKTSNYGWRWKRGHHGVDIRLRTGDPVHAAFSGTVRVARRMGGYGNCIVLRHPNGLETLYGHLSKINVKPNQVVQAGEVIGLGGSTGNSTGPHLHFECRFLYQTFDPEWLLDFSNYTLRTRRLHLDKSYFGIRQPKKGKQIDNKADASHIKERTGKSRQKSAVKPLDANNF